MTTLTQEQINWLNKCTKETYQITKGTWTLNPKTGLVDVEGGFDCSRQRLKDFKGVKFGVVTGDFYCDNNSLTSLVGAPQEVGESFCCDSNSLTSLVGAPQKVGGSFKCSYNRLTSLVEAPQRVGGSFFCNYNLLISLEGAPLDLGGNYWRLYCSPNPVSQKTLITMFSKMKKGDSFWVAATSLKNKMSKKDWELVATNIPEAIRPGVSMLGRFGLFN